jgi:predicted alpha/beta superfamily hydrolase
MKFTHLLFLLMVAAISSIAQTSSKPFVLGLIDELPSAILHEKRTLNIYLPEGYNQQDTTKYPVVYLLDGSADEDFIHVAGLFQFNNFSWIDRVPKSIVVGIANVDRKRDFTFSTSIDAEKKRYPTAGGSEKFMAFIEKELQPYIENRYNGNGSNTFIGQSLGGLFATEVLLKKPHLFNRYIIISPSLWWNDGSLLHESSAMLQDDFLIPTSVFIAVGKEGLAPSYKPHVMEVDANLLAEKLKAGKSKQVRVYLDYLPQENHATISHHAVFNALRWLHPAKK